jgi:hypothetical protein
MKKKILIALVVFLGTILFFGTINAQWTEHNIGSTNGIMSLSAPDYLTVWVVARAYDGASAPVEVRRSLDGGITWANKTMSNVQDLWCIYAWDANTAFAIGYTTGWANNVIFRTGDGGATWSVVLELTTNHFLDALTFFDANEGIAYGDPVDGVWDIFKTFDGGLTWAATKHRPNQIGMSYGWKNAITTVGNAVYFGTTHFTDEFFFGPDAFIYKSANRGETWTARTCPGVVQVNTLIFTNKQTGYGCRAKSIDNGNNWLPMADPYATVTNDINNFILSATGVGNDIWITGIHREGPNYFTDAWWNYPTIYYSSNGGMTWALNYTTPTYAFNEVRVSRDNKALFGLKDNGGGIVIKQLPGTLAPIAKDKKYELKANYPNPFNPVTTISYQIPENGLVTLKIYDILGKEVASLVNEVQNAGSFNVQWNASSFSSGTYFYKLTAGNFTETKRMMLVK